MEVDRCKPRGTRSSSWRLSPKMVLNLKWGRTRCQQQASVSPEQEQSSLDGCCGRCAGGAGHKSPRNKIWIQRSTAERALGLDALLPTPSRPACACLLTVQEVLEVLRGAALLLLSPVVSGGSSKFGLLGWEDNTQKQPQQRWQEGDLLSVCSLK